MMKRFIPGFAKSLLGIPRSIVRHWGGASRGFTLIEMLIATMVLTFGLISIGQLIYVTVSSASLARSKGNATLVAQSKLEFLSELYRQNEKAPELSNGAHGPDHAEVINPSNGKVLNRFRITWTVGSLPDPRDGKEPRAKEVIVTVVPVAVESEANIRAFQNKVSSIGCIFSNRI